MCLLFSPYLSDFWLQIICRFLNYGYQMLDRNYLCSVHFHKCRLAGLPFLTCRESVLSTGFLAVPKSADWILVHGQPFGHLEIGIWEQRPHRKSHTQASVSTCTACQKVLFYPSIHPITCFLFPVALLSYKNHRQN